MQTKQNLRTGSMMTLDDSERVVEIQNREEAAKPIVDPKREYDDVYWCMAIPDRGMKPEDGFYLRAQGVMVKILTYYKLTRSEHSALRTDCAGRRCQLVTLPPGVTPKDLGIQGR